MINTSLQNCGCPTVEAKQEILKVCNEQDPHLKVKKNFFFLNYISLASEIRAIMTVEFFSQNGET